MADARPRDLTEEELALIRAPAGRGGDAAPLRVPPGTEIAVEFLGAAREVPPASPKAPAPGEAASTPGAPRPRAKGPRSG